MLPTLVICNGDTGEVVTHWARTAMILNRDNCINEWRKGNNGLNLMTILRSSLGLDDVALNCNSA
jgi:hypothetical protein